jgi:cobalt-precorrin-5B (C1)-methyltransferase
VGGAEPLVAEVDAANTARHAFELWVGAGLLRAAGDALCAQVGDVLTRFCGLPSEVAMVDFTGRTVVAATEPEWVE